MSTTTSTEAIAMLWHQENENLQQQQEVRYRHLMAQSAPPLSTPPVVTMPIPLAPSTIMSPITTSLPPISVATASVVTSTRHAAAAVAVSAAAAHAQSSNKYAATAVTPPVANNGYMGDASIAPNFDNLLETMGGENDDVSGKCLNFTYNESNFIAKANVDSKTNINSAKKFYHPLYAHGICCWPGCELDLNDYTIFVK